jgi:hypothetical protein
MEITGTIKLALARNHKNKAAVGNYVNTLFDAKVTAKTPTVFTTPVYSFRVFGDGCFKRDILKQNRAP